MSKFSAVGLLLFALVLLAIVGAGEAKRQKEPNGIRACKCKLLLSGGLLCQKGNASIKPSTIKCFCRKTSQISPGTEMTEKQKRTLRKLCGLSKPL